MDLEWDTTSSSGWPREARTWIPASLFSCRLHTWKNLKARMGIRQPCHHISHCPRQLTNKTEDSKWSYHSRKLSQDCNQETTADSHGQASTRLMGLIRYRKNAVKRQHKALRCTERQKASVITHIHKAKHISSSPAEICRGKNREAAHYLLPKWATELTENIKFLSDGNTSMWMLQGVQARLRDWSCWKEKLMHWPFQNREP